MTTITYKLATVNDIETLVENRLQFALELAGTQAQKDLQNLRENMTNYFMKATTTGACISIIAYHSDEVAGMGSVHLREMPGNFKNPSGKWGYIMNMYTLPNHRRKGVCKGILQHLVDEGKKLGITAFELHATPAGEQVYKQNGFSQHLEPTYRMYAV